MNEVDAWVDLREEEDRSPEVNIKILEIILDAVPELIELQKQANGKV